MQYKYVFAYLRLSNDDDDKNDESNSITNQRLLINYFVRNSDEFKDAEIIYFTDDGYSGTNFKRPGFREMMIKAKSVGTSCCIIVKDLSRLGRNTIDTQNYIEKVFPFLQIRLISINDFYDSSTSIANGKETEVKFKNLINGLYPEICSENIKMVLRKRSETGKYRGSIPPYGYLFAAGKTDTLVLDPETAPVVRIIFDRRLAGATYKEIVRELVENDILSPVAYLKAKGFSYNISKDIQPVWSVTSIRHILSNSVYAGIIENHKTETTSARGSTKNIPKNQRIQVENMHKAIVTKEELEKVSAMVHHRNPLIRHQHKEKYMFTGKIKCGYCHKAVLMRSYHGKTKIKCKSVSVKGSLCYTTLHSMEEIEKLILQLVRQEALRAEKALEQIKEINKTLDITKLKRKKGAYEGRLKTCRRQKMELYEQFALGKLSKEDYLEQKKQIIQKELQYKAFSAELSEKIADSENKKAQEASPRLTAFVKYKDLEQLSYPIVQELVDTIYYYDPEHIEVVWNFQDEYIDTAVKNAG